ncbi:MAG: SGNH/GDSL hydrolase family protein [Ketobacteraceae bacterium]|nr:SGNH/GDSL hydrolase family protein [Ketobacteraceae bacterium]
MTGGCKPPLDDRRSSSSEATYEVQILGDSYFDFDFYIPDELKNLSGWEFYDRSVTNSELSDISKQFDAVLADEKADGTYTVSTIIINGGANDLKSPCVTSKNRDGLSSGCTDALIASREAIKNLLAKMAGEVESIVWAGRYYMAESTAPQAAVDAHNENIIAECAKYTNCYFVEVRGYENDGDDLRWSYAEGTPADEGGLYIKNDGQHVTEKGAVRIATLIWQVMMDNGVYPYR